MLPGNPRGAAQRDEKGSGRCGNMPGGRKSEGISKGETGNAGTGTKANIDADADSESERPSAFGINTVPGPPIDSDDDHDKQAADATVKEEDNVDLQPDQ